MPPDLNHQQNPYDFILRDTPPPKRQLNLGSSMPVRIAIIVGGLLLLIVMFAVVSSLLGSASNAHKQRLIEAGQAQTEIIRIAKLAEEQAGDLGVRSLAVTTQLSLSTDQQAIKTALTKRGIKEKSLDKTFGTTKNPKTDAALEEATANNRFDDTFLEILDKQLNDYKRLIQNAGSSANNAEKNILKTALTNVETIQKSKLLQTATSSKD